jgi:predicted transcriptional regulator
MKRTKTCDSTELCAILKILSHPRKLQLVLYLRDVGMATNAVLSKKLECSKSTVSKNIKALMALGLVKREKIFSTTIFKVDQQRLEHVKEMLVLL